MLVLFTIKAMFVNDILIFQGKLLDIFYEFFLTVINFKFCVWTFLKPQSVAYILMGSKNISLSIKQPQSIW